MFATALAVLGIICAAVQLFYSWYFFSRIRHDAPPKRCAGSKNSSLRRAEVDISVIICAKNEAENLRENLTDVLEQEFHDGAGHTRYEVIVVNDASTDETAQVLNSFKARYAHLVILNIDPRERRVYPGKKFALSRGVEAAKFPFVLMTDADCRPTSLHWIHRLAYPFTQGRQIVAGYSPYRRRPGLLNRFIRFETVHTFLQYATYCRAGNPYMAVGRNLACAKALLIQAEARPQWKATASGDDDMLVQLCATKSNMTVVQDRESFTVSEAKRTLSEWMAQKRRHLSVGKFYTSRTQMIVGLYALTHTGLWASVLIWIFVYERTNPLQLGILFILLFVLSRATIWNSFNRACDRQSKDLRIAWPLLDFCWMLYNLFFAPYILWKNKQTWK